jgi:hypothetical protein
MAAATNTYDAKVEHWATTWAVRLLSPSSAFFATTSLEVTATSLTAVAKSPASNQFVALQSRMLINESNDIMTEVCDADKEKVAGLVTFL